MSVAKEVDEVVEEVRAEMEASERSLESRRLLITLVHIFDGFRLRRIAMGFGYWLQAKLLVEADDGHQRVLLEQAVELRTVHEEHQKKICARGSYKNGLLLIRLTLEKARWCRLSRAMRLWGSIAVEASTEASSKHAFEAELESVRISLVSREREAVQATGRKFGMTRIVGMLASWSETMVKVALVRWSLNTVDGGQRGKMRGVILRELYDGTLEEGGVEKACLRWRVGTLIAERTNNVHVEGSNVTLEATLKAVEQVAEARIIHAQGEAHAALCRSNAIGELYDDALEKIRELENHNQRLLTRVEESLLTPRPLPGVPLSQALLDRPLPLPGGSTSRTHTSASPSFGSSRSTSTEGAAALHDWKDHIVSRLQKGWNACDSKLLEAFVETALKNPGNGFPSDAVRNAFEARERKSHDLRELEGELGDAYEALKQEYGKLLMDTGANVA